MQSSRDAQLARFYDLEYRHYSEDLDFYAQYALQLDPERALPVLELGCGTGRILVKLGKAGFRAVGVDISEAMLAICQERAQEAGVANMVEAVRWDMRHLGGVPPGPYNMALCAINTFAHLTSTADQLSMLRAVRPLLVSHGILILDLTPPQSHTLAWDGELLHQGSYEDEETGVTVHKLVSGVADAAAQLQQITLFYDVEGSDGSLFRLTHQMALRWTGRFEMELLLQAAGYELEALYGSYDLDEFDQGSERMIFVARRGGDPVT